MDIARAKRRIKKFASEQTDGVHYCPRCGKWAVPDRLHKGAWSRYANVYICEACGADEARRDADGRPLPLTDWAIVKRAGR